MNPIVHDAASVVVSGPEPSIDPAIAKRHKNYDAGSVVYGLLILLLIACCQQSLCAEPPRVNYLFPAGTQRGTTTTIKADGSFPEWPVEVTCDRADVAVKALEKKGEFELTIPAEVPCGVYALQFPAKKDETNERAFAIGALPETGEGERNDDPLDPHEIDGNVTINGRFSKRGDVDTFAVTLEAGQTLLAAIEANWKLGSPLDAVLQICGPRGFVIEQNHDGRGLDPLIVFTAPATGTYLVRGFAFPSQPNSTIGLSGGDEYIYRLTLTTGGFVHHALPLAVPRGEAADVKLFGWNFDPIVTRVEAGNDDEVRVYHAELAGSVRLPVAKHRIVLADESIAREPQRIELPADLSGCLANEGDAHTYRFTAEKGDKLKFRLHSRSLGFPLDAVLKLTDANTGDELAENDDNKKEHDPELSFTVKSDGEHEIRVSDLHGRGGMRYAYRVIAEFDE